MNLSWSQLNEQIIEQAREKGIPVTGQFELTPRCNLQCKMCYICTSKIDKDAIAHERSSTDWISLAAEARDAGMLHLLLTGGEVFLRQDFKSIYDEISMMGFVTEIYTNATLITPHIASWLGCKPPSKVAVSIYGASPETYQRVCGYANGYEQAVRGIDLLLSQGITVDLRTTIVKENVSDFTKLAEFAEKRGIEFGIVNYVSPRRNVGNTHPESERLSPLELAKFESFAEDFYRKKQENEVGSINAYNSPPLSNKVESKKNVQPDKKMNGPFNCTAGQCSFWITWDGRMTLCGQVDKPSAYPLKNGFNTAWRDLQNLCFSIPICKECQQCTIKEYCTSCPAMLEAETGTFDKPAPYLCQLAQNRKDLKNLNIDKAL